MNRFPDSAWALGPFFTQDWTENDGVIMDDCQKSLDMVCCVYKEGFFFYCNSVFCTSLIYNMFVWILDEIDNYFTYNAISQISNRFSLVLSASFGRFWIIFLPESDFSDLIQFNDCLQS